jgi:hypothetical protein
MIRLYKPHFAWTLLRKYLAAYRYLHEIFAVDFSEIKIKRLVRS